LSAFGYKIAYNTSLFDFKSLATAHGGTGEHARRLCLAATHQPALLLLSDVRGK